MLSYNKTYLSKITSLVFMLVYFMQASALIYPKNNYDKSITALRSLDIDSSFITSLEFISIEEDVSLFRKQAISHIVDNSYIFTPMIQQEIQNSNIPEAFMYLVMIESHFNLNAKSSKNAIGLWQFMPATATRYGLAIDMYVDERRDPIKSTQAAIKYLKYLKDMFGKWYLAAMAYNCGEGRLLSAIKKSNSDDIAVLLDPDKKYIPKETRDYIRKIILATLYMNKNEFNLDYIQQFLNSGTTSSITAVDMSGGSSLQKVATAIGIEVDYLKYLNSHLNYYFIPPNRDQYTIYIPYSSLSKFNLLLEKSKNDYKSIINYRVKSGDTFLKIAKEYNVPYKIIKDYNNIKTDTLYADQNLIIPIRATYKIKDGDSLYTISKKFNVNIDTIKKINNINTSIILVDQKIVIPN